MVSRQVRATVTCIRAPLLPVVGELVTPIGAMKLAALCLLAGLGVTACSRSQIKNEPKNIVLLSIDTLRSDSLRAYDRSARPHATLDGLAHRGHVFARAYSTASWTLPAHVSLFTGLYPAGHGVVGSRHTMGDVSTCVEKLRASGYQTVGFTDGGYVGAHYGFSRGFEIYDGLQDGEAPVTAYALPRGGKRDHDAKATLFDRATAFLKGRSDRRPLFLFVHTYAVHDYFRTWQPTAPGESPSATASSKHHLECLIGALHCAPEDWKELEAKYEAGIDDVDRALKSFLGLLEQKLDMDATFIVVLSDHGEGFDHERGRIHHGGRLHRDQLQIPLVVTGPGIDASRSDEPVSLVDVRASLLELAGLTDDRETDGVSFVPQLHGKAASPRRDAVWASEYYHYWEAGKRRAVPEPSPTPLSIARVDTHHWYIGGSRGEELYDVSDRGQAKSLSDLLERYPKPNRRPSRVGAKPSKTVETIEVIEQLRALGYVE